MPARDEPTPGCPEGRGIGARRRPRQNAVTKPMPGVRLELTLPEGKVPKAGRASLAGTAPAECETRQCSTGEGRVEAPSWHSRTPTVIVDGKPPGSGSGSPLVENVRSVKRYSLVAWMMRS